MPAPPEGRATPMIEVEHISKVFRVAKKAPGLRGSLRGLFRREYVDRHAVKDVSFRVEEGEIVGLVGQNGAGKTTLVKMLAGIVHRSAGSARVLGFDPWDRRDEFRRRIALLMGQKAQLWWDLPASDGFDLLREIYRVPADEFRRSLDELVSVLGVGSLLDVPVRRLSLGERMKMELIAALLHGPKVVFLDEPTIGLDLGAQRAVREFLLAYRERHRPAMILTSHYMEDIERLCKRILILKEGELVFDGSLDRVVTRYADHRVLTVHLRKEEGRDADPAALARLGTVVESTPDLVRIRVSRAQTAVAAGELLRILPVADLAIEEPDVASIVEKIFSERGSPAS
jgi:ABC-2 type transport system ATP-binding protein